MIYEQDLAEAVTRDGGTGISTRCTKLFDRNLADDGDFREDPP